LKTARQQAGTSLPGELPAGTGPVTSEMK